MQPSIAQFLFCVLGGVGWAATQLASKVVNDVTVFGTSSSNKHKEIVSNGVITPLTYSNYVDNIPKTGVDIIIDNIGGENLKKSIDLLRPLGHVIVTGSVYHLHSYMNVLSGNLMSTTGIIKVNIINPKTFSTELRLHLVHSS